MAKPKRKPPVEYQYKPKGVNQLIISGKSYLTRDKFGNVEVDSKKLFNDLNKMTGQQQAQAMQELRKLVRQQAKQSNQRLKRLESVPTYPGMTRKEAEDFQKLHPGLDLSLTGTPAYRFAQKVTEGRKSTRFRERVQTVGLADLIQQLEDTTHFLRLKTGTEAGAKHGESGNINGILKRINEKLGGLTDYDADGEPYTRDATFNEVYDYLHSTAYKYNKEQGYDFINIVQRYIETENATGASTEALANEIDTEQKTEEMQELTEVFRDPKTIDKFAHKLQTDIKLREKYKKHFSKKE